MILRTALLAAGALALAACAETPTDETNATVSGAASPPVGSNASATAPTTVNPAPADGRGQPIPDTPPTLPPDPAADDDAMPPGPVNPD